MLVKVRSINAGYVYRSTDIIWKDTYKNKEYTIQPTTKGFALCIFNTKEKRFESTEVLKDCNLSQSLEIARNAISLKARSENAKFKMKGGK